MNIHEINDDGLLRKFLSPEKIENAPEGFTSKTLTRIRIETQSDKMVKGFFVKYRVPVISAAITAGLIIASVIIPSGGAGSLGSTFWKYIQDLDFPLPSLSLPGWISSAMIGAFFLGFFDRALFGIFHKEKAPKSPKGDLKLL
jgi:hypothetical protein